jgi:hypothetical protein
MECVCGCGRNLSGKQTDRNFIAAGVALELLAWDKARVSPGPEAEGREGLIARGADCYQRLLWSIHGEGAGEPDEDCRAWLKESEALRATRPEMNKAKFLGTGSPNLGEADMARLDRKRPELSFSGDDLVDQLERLRSLHAEGALTEAEFAAAKARLLDRG